MEKPSAKGWYTLGHLNDRAPLWKGSQKGTGEKVWMKLRAANGHQLPGALVKEL